MFHPRRASYFLLAQHLSLRLRSSTLAAALPLALLQPESRIFVPFPGCSPGGSAASCFLAGMASVLLWRVGLQITQLAERLGLLC